jgi:hypothetical protein
MKKLLLTLLIISVTLAKSISIAQIGYKMRDNMQGFKSSISTLEMILISKSGKKSIKTIKLKTLEGDENTSSMALMEFITPRDVKGTKLLTHEIKGGKTRQWIYLPILKRPKEIKSRGRSGSFMGSEFSYEDLGNQNFEDFDYKGKAVEIYENNKAIYKGQRTPKDKKSGYKKQIFYIDANSFLLTKVEYYDKRDKKYKTATFDNYKKIDNIYRVTQITMINHKNKKSSILRWKDDKIFVGLKAKDFDYKALK